MSIELAPRNKRGLVLASPLIAGSGGFGHGDAWPPGLTPALFGAIVTGPISARPRKGLEAPRLAECPGGFVLATGDHNPGFQRVVASQAALWRRLRSQDGLPVLLSLVGGDPGDRAWMAAHLEEEDCGAAGLELPVPEDVNLGEASAFISAVRHATTLPLLVKLPATRAAHLARACLIAGADALVVGSPPPVVYPTAEGVLLEGPLAGPAALGFTLRALHSVLALHLEAPVVAAGGIFTAEDVALCLEMGASAVQVRSLLWTDPAAALQVAEAARSLLPVAASGRGSA